MHTPAYENQLLFVARVSVSTFTSSISSEQRADKEVLSARFLQPGYLGQSQRQTNKTASGMSIKFKRKRCKDSLRPRRGYYFRIELRNL
jgi:hypothetical protein